MLNRRSSVGKALFDEEVTKEIRGRDQWHKVHLKMKKTEF